MENQQENSLFGLSIDSVTAGYLKETASWAKLLAIVGMIGCVFLVLGGIMASVAVTTVSSEMSREIGGGATAAMGAFMLIFYVLIAVIYFFPCLYLLRFSNHIKNAITANDQMGLNEGLRNLKATFRFLGIVTIIFISLFLLMFLLGGLGAIMSV